MATLVASLVLGCSLAAGARVVQNDGATTSDTSRRNAGAPTKMLRALPPLRPTLPYQVQPLARSTGLILRTDRDRIPTPAIQHVLALRGGAEGLLDVETSELPAASMTTEASETEAPPIETRVSERATVEQRMDKREDLPDVHATELPASSATTEASEAEALPIETSASDRTTVEHRMDKRKAQDMPTQAKATRWRFLHGVLNLLTPSHAYARKEKAELGQILGDASQISGFAPDDQSWRTQRKVLHVVPLSDASRKRILRDLRVMKHDGPELGLEVEDAKCLTDWVIKMVGAPGTTYQGEIYRLRVRFPADYPAKPPTVNFMRPSPVHKHIYSDGKICLNILYDDWRPGLDIKSLALSLLSMLSSAKTKRRPPDNDLTVIAALGKKSGKLKWQFDDDRC